MNKQQQIRAIVRSATKGIDWEQRGAEIAVADLFDATSLTRAFRGAESIFIMTPPALDLEHPVEQHLKMLDSIITALKAAKPRKVVYLSSIGGHLADGTGAIRKLYDMEQALTQLNVPTAGIRAGWFMENFTGLIPGAIASGSLVSFINPPSLLVPMVAATDIGNLAGDLLLEEWQGHRIIELEGPRPYSADDVASILSNYSDRKITAIPIPQKDYEQTYSSFGFTANASRLMAIMNDGFNSQHIVFEGQNTEHVNGPTSLEDMLKAHIH